MIRGEFHRKGWRVSSSVNCLEFVKWMKRIDASPLAKVNNASAAVWHNVVQKELARQPMAQLVTDAPVFTLPEGKCRNCGSHTTEQKKDYGKWFFICKACQQEF